MAIGQNDSTRGSPIIRHHVFNILEYSTSTNLSSHGLTHPHVVEFDRSWEAAAAATWELALMTIGDMEAQALEVQKWGPEKVAKNDGFW